MLVGEDLGTVSGYMRKAMERTGLQRMYCLLAEIRPDPKHALPDPIEDALASLGTHDMPTFASFLERSTSKSAWHLATSPKKKHPKSSNRDKGSHNP